MKKRIAVVADSSGRWSAVGAHFLKRDRARLNEALDFARELNESAAEYIVEFDLPKPVKPKVLKGKVKAVKPK